MKNDFALVRFGKRLGIECREGEQERAVNALRRKFLRLADVDQHDGPIRETFSYFFGFKMMNFGHERTLVVDRAERRDTDFARLEISASLHNGTGEQKCL